MLLVNEFICLSATQLMHATGRGARMYATQFSIIYAVQNSELLLSYGPNKSEFNQLIKEPSLQQCKYEVQVNKIEVTKQRLVELWKSSNNNVWVKIFDFRVSLFCQMMRKYYLDEVENNFAVSAESINTFKNRLDKFWSDQDVLFDYKADLHGIGNRSIIY